MSELKACPFCESKSNLISEHKSDCYLRVLLQLGDLNGWCGHLYNIRPIESALQSQLDEAREIITNDQIFAGKLISEKSDLFGKLKSAQEENKRYKDALEKIELRYSNRLCGGEKFMYEVARDALNGGK
jgi:hypothetical protein